MTCFSGGQVVAVRQCACGSVSAWRQPSCRSAVAPGPVPATVACTPSSPAQSASGIELAVVDLGRTPTPCRTSVSRRRPARRPTRRRRPRRTQVERFEVQASRLVAQKPCRSDVSAVGAEVFVGFRSGLAAHRRLSRGARSSGGYRPRESIDSFGDGHLPGRSGPRPGLRRHPQCPKHQAGVAQAAPELPFETADRVQVLGGAGVLVRLAGVATQRHPDGVRELGRRSVTGTSVEHSTRTTPAHGASAPPGAAGTRSRREKRPPIANTGVRSPGASRLTNRCSSGGRYATPCVLITPMAPAMCWRPVEWTVDHHQRLVAVAARSRRGRLRRLDLAPVHPLLQREPQVLRAWSRRRRARRSSRARSRSRPHAPMR